MRLLVLVSACAALIGATTAVGATAAAAPQPVTDGASEVTGTTAIVTGAIAPEGLAVSYTFQYGTTRHYGKYTLPINLPPSTTTETTSAELTGLRPHTTYHYRLAVRVGVAPGNYYASYYYGADARFTTTRAGSVTLSSKTATVKGGQASVTLKCSSVSACQGTLNLYLPFHKKKASSAAYSIKAGRRASVTVELSRLILGVLDASSTHTTTVKATLGPATGQKGFRNTNLVLLG